MMNESKCKLMVAVGAALFAGGMLATFGGIPDAMRGPALKRLVKDGEPDVTAKVCDFQSAADARLGDCFTWFTIWF